VPTVFHICLAGEHVTRQQELVLNLRQGHQVTLVDHPDHLLATGLLGSADVLVLDSAGDTTGLSRLLGELRDRFPRLRVVLVNGGLGRREVVDAFGSGIADYFPQPCDVSLLSARIEVLATRLRDGIRRAAPRDPA
jgi:DNA-binding response OmpR family regulator